MVRCICVTWTSFSMGEGHLWRLGGTCIGWRLSESGGYIHEYLRNNLFDDSLRVYISYGVYCV